MNTLRTTLGIVLLTLWLSGCAVPGGQEAARPVANEGSGAAKPFHWSRSMEGKRVALERSTRDSGIAVLRTRDNQLQINVPSDFSFDTDSAAIKPGMRPVLDELAADLDAKEMSRMLIVVVGHTDSRGADAGNDKLALARAVNVGKYLEGKGVASGRISIQGRGEHEPLADNDKGYGRALNRRVEIFLREPADASS